MRPDAQRVLDWWEAVDRIWPLSDPWHQTAQVSSMIDKLTCALYTTNGVQGQVPKPFEHHMPARYVAPKGPLPKAQSNEAQIAAVHGAFGGMR